MAAGGARKRCVAERLRGRKRLFEISTLVTPDTPLRWYRRRIAKKYDGSKNRTAGRPITAAEIEELSGQEEERPVSAMAPGVGMGIVEIGRVDSAPNLAVEDVAWRLQYSAYRRG